MRIRVGLQMGVILPLVRKEQMATTIFLLLMPMGKTRDK
jgi:hypothetical protein